MADCNKLLIINTSKTKEIVFKRPSLRQYVPLPPVMYIEQVDHVKLLGVFYSATPKTSTHTNRVIACSHEPIRRAGARYMWPHKYSWA